MNDWRIECGDGAVLLREYAGQANLILTSPPYDNLRTYGGHGFDFDRMADASVLALAEGGVLVWVVADATVDGSETGTSFRQALGFMERGLKLHDTMIYESTRQGALSYNRCFQVWDYMFVFSAGEPTQFNPILDKENLTAGRVFWEHHGSGRGADGALHRRRQNGHVVPSHGKRTNIWRYAVGYAKNAPDFCDSHQHPAIFPYALASDHIRTWTNEGDLVIDPMAGSGTTIRAAVDLGRRAIGFDIHEPYVELARRRMAQAVLL